MKFIPILFSTDMVKANLAGIKTNTRRTNGLNSINKNPDAWEFVGKPNFWYKFKEVGFTNPTYRDIKCPYGQIGDVLWVRESFGITGHPTYKNVYKADCESKFDSPYSGWKPSIHMPKSAARLFLQITDIRIERLHDITTKDILQEGVRIPVINKENGNNRVIVEITNDNSAYYFLPEDVKNSDRQPTQDELLYAFWAELWCKINGRSSWDKNPFVWVIEYKQIPKPKNFI